METKIELRKKEIEESLKSLKDAHQKKVEKIIGTLHNLSVSSVNHWFDTEVVTLMVKDGEGNGISQIKICYSKGCEPLSGEEFTTNLAAMGSFGLLDGNKVAQYYMAVGELLHQKGMLNRLKDEMVSFLDAISELRDEYRTLK